MKRLTFMIGFIALVGCGDGAPPNPPSATCVDGIKNGYETDVDCGGGDCPACADAKACGRAEDCLSSLCTSHKCTDSCDDGARNGTETDVDCGGDACPACEQGRQCYRQGDCRTPLNCTNNICRQQ